MSFRPRSSRAQARPIRATTACSEDPSQHIVRIEWDSEQGHLSGFRQSPEFGSFYEAVAPFVNDIEEMRHYQVTLASDN